MFGRLFNTVPTVSEVPQTTPRFGGLPAELTGLSI